MSGRIVHVRHWLPIVTVCPVNHLPDLIYITVTFQDEGLDDLPVHELYGIRKRVRQIASWKKKFMEDIADEVFCAIRGCASVTVTLAFGRHEVTRYED